MNSEASIAVATNYIINLQHSQPIEPEIIDRKNATMPLMRALKIPEFDIDSSRTFISAIYSVTENIRRIVRFSVGKT
jgi:hypothetical protein